MSTKSNNSRNITEHYEIEDIESYDYHKTKDNVERLFSQYRNYKNKQDIITKRYNSSFSLDNLGIFSSTISDPVYNKVEQLEKYNNFIATIEQAYNLYSYMLDNDEKIIFSKYLLTRHKDDDLMEELCINSRSSLYYKKKKCLIKVALWFDLEVLL